MEDTNTNAFVFVLMPFDESFDDIYEYGIKQGCRDAGAFCERVDEQVFNESILARVYDQIAKADIIIAEMTGRNANVFYETGYAHALNKQVILITQNANDIPFDLKHHSHIIYGGKIKNLRPGVEKRVRRCIENLKLASPETNRQMASSTSHMQLDFFVNDVSLKGIPTVHIEVGNTWLHSLTITAHNPTTSAISGKILDIAIAVPREVQPHSKLLNIVEQAHGVALCTLPRFRPIFPGKRESICFKFVVFDPDSYDPFSVEEPLVTGLEMSLHLFTEMGADELPFLVQFDRRLI